jgi:hypothetical protein
MRVELELDGRLLSRGPTRSDPYRWDAVSVDLGQLAAGKHELTASVAHFGQSPEAPCAQMGPPAFFLCCGEGDLAGVIDSGTAWECQWDASFGSTGRNAWSGPGRYFPMGYGEQIAWGATDDPWVPAKVLATEAADRWGNLPLRARFRAAVLPPMIEEPRPWKRLDVAPSELRSAANPWSRGESELVVPAGSRVRLVLDAGDLVNAWPGLSLDGGTGARIEVTWAEAPYRDEKTKAHRDEIARCEFPGFRDVVHGPGRSRVWAPSWLRSFRYVCLDITTDAAPLRLGPVTLKESTFPMRPPEDLRLAGPSADDWHRVFDACWRTIQLCAHEAIWDCPHWEQCQFSGDARLQVLWHYALCGEDRLARKALDDFHASRLPDGMVQCRWPSNLDQILPTYALQWVLMLDDFVRWRGATEFAGGYLHGARAAVAWFLERRRTDGLIGRVDYAPFVDWADAFRPDGNAPQGVDGGSSILTAMVAQACAALARLELACGWTELAGRWREAHAVLVRALRDRCWVNERGLFADVAGKDGFSLHAQVEAVAAGAMEGAEALAMIDRALGAADVAQPGTLYYHGHLQLAFRRLGVGGRIHNRLGEWVSCLQGNGLKTLPETLNANPRSDCHGWSAIPGLELAAAVLGVEPAADAVGADVLVWRPDLGALQQASATLPHPRGAVRVELERSGDTVTGRIESPVPVLVHGQRLPAGSHTERWSVFDRD